MKSHFWKLIVEDREEFKSVGGASTETKASVAPTSAVRLRSGVLNKAGRISKQQQPRHDSPGRGRKRARVEAQNEVRPSLQAHRMPVSQTYHRLVCSQNTGSLLFAPLTAPPCQAPPPLASSSAPHEPSVVWMSETDNASLRLQQPVPAELFLYGQQQQYPARVLLVYAQTAGATAPPPAAPAFSASPAHWYSSQYSAGSGHGSGAESSGSVAGDTDGGAFAALSGPARTFDGSGGDDVDVWMKPSLGQFGQYGLASDRPLSSTPFLSPGAGDAQRSDNTSRVGCTNCGCRQRRGLPLSEQDSSVTTGLAKSSSKLSAVSAAMAGRLPENCMADPPRRSWRAPLEKPLFSAMMGLVSLSTQVALKTALVVFVCMLLVAALSSRCDPSAPRACLCAIHLRGISSDTSVLLPPHASGIDAPPFAFIVSALAGSSPLFFCGAHGLSGQSSGCDFPHSIRAEQGPSILVLLQSAS